MTTTAVPTSTSLGKDLAFGVPLMAAGVACLVLLALSDASGPRSFPPDNSLYGVLNWLEAVAVVTGGLLIAIPRVPQAAKAAAAGVALISAGLVFGTAVWAMKSWASYRGVIGLDFQRVDKMEQLTVFVSAASLVAAALALSWLALSGGISTNAGTKVRNASILAGVITILVVPPMIGIGSGDDALMDVTSLGTFALLFSLPWGLAFILAAFLVRPAALGALTTAAATMAWWAVSALLYPELVIGAIFGLVLLTCGWLIALHWRSRATTALT
jgi:hypothetical protein